MPHPLHGIAVTAVLLLATGCGPSTHPSEPECGTEDITPDAQLVIGSGGPACDPCPADAELYIAATLSTECGPVDWQLPSTCLVGAVQATRSSDGEVFSLPTRNCGSAFTEWSVDRDRPIVVYEPSVSLVFDMTPIPPGDYVFEVGFPSSLEIETASFSVTVAPP